MYRHLDDFRDGQAFMPWMLRLARNCCIDRIRSRQARPQEPPCDGRVPSSARHRDASPEESLLEDARRVLFYRALATLTATSREIVLLKDIQEMRISEISTRLGLPSGTVKSRSNRARSELAKAVRSLEDGGGGRSHELPWNSKARSDRLLDGTIEARRARTSCRPRGVVPVVPRAGGADGGVARPSSPPSLPRPLLAMVLARTSHEVRRARWAETWHQWMLRPRFASEAAYVGVVLLSLSFVTLDRSGVLNGLRSEAGILSIALRLYGRRRSHDRASGRSTVRQRPRHERHGRPAPQVAALRHVPLRDARTGAGLRRLLPARVHQRRSSVGTLIAPLSSKLGPLTPLGGAVPGVLLALQHRRCAAAARFSTTKRWHGRSGIELPEDFKTPRALLGSIPGGLAIAGRGRRALSHTRFGFPLDWVSEWWPAALILFRGLPGRPVGHEPLSGRPAKP